jgi:polar amino acid transport system permease protein
MADPGLLAPGPGGWGDELFWGAAGTLALALAALPLGLAGGLVIGFAKASPERSFRVLANTLTTVFRGLPELLTILLVYILGQRALNALGQTVGVEAATIGLFPAGVAALAVVFSAYAGEVFYGCLRALERGSLEAARSLALGPVVTLRFVTLPELFRLASPGLTNLVVSMLKQTSLVSVIGFDELVRAGYVAATSTGERLFFYAVVCVIYFMLCRGSEALFTAWVGRIGDGGRGRWRVGQ